MHLEAHVNGKGAKVMVDTKVSYNFIRTRQAKRLGLKLEMGQRRLKTINLEIKPIDGLAHRVELYLGHWKGVLNL